MSMDLRLKIQTQTSKDPEDKGDWAYKELQQGIKYNALEPVNLAPLKTY